MTVGFALYRDGDPTPYFSTEGGFILGSTGVSLAAGGSASLTDANISFGSPFSFAVNDADIFQTLNVSFAGNVMTYSAPDGFTGTLFYGIHQ